MEELNFDYVDESMVVNQTYFEEIKADITCLICSGLVIDPIKCSNCENSFCKLCIEQWKKVNVSCPLRCSPVLSKYVEVPRIIKNLLERAIIKCRNGCITNLKNFKDHMVQCKFSHMKVNYLKKENEKLNTNLEKKEKFLESGLLLNQERLKSKIIEMDIKLRVEKNIFTANEEEIKAKEQEFSKLTLHYNEILSTLKSKREKVKTSMNILNTQMEQLNKDFQNEIKNTNKVNNSEFKNNNEDNFNDFNKVYTKVSTEFVLSKNKNVVALNANKSINMTATGMALLVRIQFVKVV